MQLADSGTRDVCLEAQVQGPQSGLYTGAALDTSAIVVVMGPSTSHVFTLITYVFTGAGAAVRALHRRRS
jgi:hypothetical protein